MELKAGPRGAYAARSPRSIRMRRWWRCARGAAHLSSRCTTPTSDRVLGYVRLRNSRRRDLQDVTSTVFTTALAQLGRFRGERQLRGLVGPDRTERGCVTFTAGRGGARSRSKPGVPSLNLEGGQFLARETGPATARRGLSPQTGRQQHLPRDALRSGSRLRRDRGGSSAPIQERSGPHAPILEELRTEVPP